MEIQVLFILAPLPIIFKMPQLVFNRHIPVQFGRCIKMGHIRSLSTSISKTAFAQKAILKHWLGLHSSFMHSGLKIFRCNIGLFFGFLVLSIFHLFQISMVLIFYIFNHFIFISFTEVKNMVTLTLFVQVFTLLQLHLLC